MREHRSRGLWIAAVVATALVVAAVLVDPADLRRIEEPDELAAVIEKADTYFEFEHYDRAAQSYLRAVELGMDDGAAWYRYARAVELSSGLDLEKYVAAYRLLLAGPPAGDYLDLAEEVLTAHAVPFSYEDARADALAEGTLTVATGTIFRIRRGRIDTGTDTLFIDTRPDTWFGYLGDPVRIVAPKHLTLQSGDTVSAIGWYDGWCEVSDDAGLSHAYPCVIAAGVTVTAP